MKDIKAYTEIMSRYLLATQLGQQFGGDRDIYKALGYKVKLRFQDYMAQYQRQDIARAIIDRPVNGTWQGDISLMESDDADTTALEQGFEQLKSEVRLKSNLIRLDKLASIGHYAVLLMGFDDITTPMDWAEPIAKGRKLLYVKPLSEEAAPIKTTVESPQNSRYGLPLLYEVQTEQVTLLVHHTRVIHVVSGQLDDEVTGTPALKPVFNRLKDLEKLVGGSAEMFWKGAFPGYQGKIKDDFQIDEATKKQLRDEIAEYEHGLRRFLINQGVELSALTSQVSDPRSHVDIQVQMISAQTGIPKRILTGSERGELASSEDKNSWNGILQSRREEYAEEMIVRPFVDRCIEYGVLPAAKERYTIQWSDLFAVGEKEMAEVGRIRAAALKEYASQPLAAEILPPVAFMEFMLGLDREQIELITEMQEEAMIEEERAALEDREEDDPENDLIEE